ncbi:golgi SNAP receptor complex member 2 [Homo sapiens]|uniref:Golgi SNAP receptor complex member 2 n=1 Tax=Homo sapiens TaxID=9606 RepID=A0A1W2PPE0_HUMAN|nr:golgi SNAP receptor complex member 2 [Homo sapiens]KAI4050127.1 golgi SNAP receptor complex member 2 [Homo sapiens]
MDPLFQQTHNVLYSHRPALSELLRYVAGPRDPVLHGTPGDGRQAVCAQGLRRRSLTLPTCWACPTQ